MSLLAGTTIMGLQAQNLTYNRFLNWSSNTWSPPGILTNNFKFDTTNPASYDISFSLTTNNLDLRTAANPSPFVTNQNDGGLGNNALLMSFNAPNNNTNTTFAAVTFEFNYTNINSIVGVSNVSFQIYDIDNGGTFQDRLFNISGTNNAGQVIYANLSAVTSAPSFSITGSGAIDNQVLGTNAAPNQGTGAFAGSLQVDFGTNVMVGIYFIYGPGPAGPVDPGNQSISLGPIYYYIEPIPEPGTVNLLGLALMAVLFGWFLKRRPPAPEKQCLK
ncbi:MAG: PEP-CTERM sorting domain-containing protein [Verrucomicrobiae bacterium]|nr:PEP-CTERM sorting domain-containing protein [Verrucomicrobiae bacterium]